jgi:hypothetical protein
LVVVFVVRRLLVARLLWFLFVLRRAVCLLRFRLVFVRLRLFLLLRFLVLGLVRGVLLLWRLVWVVLCWWFCLLGRVSLRFLPRLLLVFPLWVLRLVAVVCGCVSKPF